MLNMISGSYYPPPPEAYDQMYAVSFGFLSSRSVFSNYSTGAVGTVSSPPVPSRAVQYAYTVICLGILFFRQRFSVARDGQ